VAETWQQIWEGVLDGEVVRMGVERLDSGKVRGQVSRHDLEETVGVGKVLETMLPQLSSFIGREHEIAQVKTLLSKARLLTPHWLLRRRQDTIGSPGGFSGPGGVC
jgi:hypothetical protein